MTNIAQLKEKVKGILVSWNGSVTEDAAGRFTIPYESTQVFVGVLDFRDMPVVQMFAPVALGIEISEQLALRALSKETGFFGEWEVWDYDEATNKGTLMIAQVLLGEKLDDIELKLSLAFVVNAANNATKWVVPEFGGVTFKDA